MHTSEQDRSNHAGFMTRAYRKMARPVLFQLSPNQAHSVAGLFLRYEWPARLLRSRPDYGRDTLSLVLRDKVMLRGPIGLAAGFDKDLQMLNGLGQLFDYVTAGTMLPYQWNGNPEPRIVRRVEDRALVNCSGFPFGGVEKAVRRLERYRGDAAISLSLSVRPVEGEGQHQALDHFKRLLDRIAGFIPQKVKILEFNFASPNTKGLAVFFEEKVFENMARLVTEMEPFRYALLIQKMPPHYTISMKERNLDVARRWIGLGGDGFTVTNTLREEEHRLSMGAGGLSGEPIYKLMKENLVDYRVLFGDKVVINASGGVTAATVSELVLGKLADTVQIFTPLVYDGPGIIGDMRKALVEGLRNGLYHDLEDLRR